MKLTITTEVTLEPYDLPITFEWNRPRMYLDKKAWKAPNGNIKFAVVGMHLQPLLKLTDEQHKSWVKEMKKHKTDVFYYKERNCFVTYAQDGICQIKNFNELLRDAGVTNPA